MTPKTKGRILYELITVHTDWEEKLSNLASFDINKRREEAALALIREGVHSFRDWRETLEHIGQIQSGTLVPQVEVGVDTAAKTRRADENCELLHRELFNDAEDWNALQEYLQQLPD